MSSMFADPDIKINMSLDEIIRLSKEELNGQLAGKGGKQKRRRKNNSNENSVSFLPSASEVGNNLVVDDVEERRRFTQAVSNRGMNSDLLQKTKKIIPAEYKLLKTSSGVERILVPVSEYYTKRQKQILRPRKLNKTEQKLNFDYNTLSDKPPPLMSTLIYDPPKQTKNDHHMQVDGYDNDVKEVCVANKKKNLQVTDLESDLPVDVMEAKRMCVVPPSGAEIKTLSDRFTMLTGSFKF